jgi:hypothetical protein
MNSKKKSHDARFCIKLRNEREQNSKLVTEADGKVFITAGASDRIGNAE